MLYLLLSPGMTSIKYSKAVLKYEDEDVYVELDARVLPANKGMAIRQPSRSFIFIQFIACIVNTYHTTYLNTIFY